MAENEREVLDRICEKASALSPEQQESALLILQGMAIESERRARAERSA